MIELNPVRKRANKTFLQRENIILEVRIHHEDTKLRLSFFCCTPSIYSI